MKSRIVVTSKEIGENEFNVGEHEVIGGKLAGICYMADNYFSEAIHNTEGAVKRANMTSKSGHHSVFGHSSFTMIFEGIPKILAMLLNSTQLYTTSEKSARYTLMKPETEIEETLYNKWRQLYTNKIASEYPNIPDKQVDKLAQENARYLISIFTPTTMAYTTTFCQWNYLVDWMEVMMDRLSSLDGTFNNRLLREVDELRKQILDNLGDKKIKDPKNRYFKFLPMQNGYSYQYIQEHYGDTYTRQYDISLAGLAHIHRHRTLTYEMQFSGKEEDIKGFYIPEILKDDKELKEEWIRDMQSVKHVYPQGMMVNVIEYGTADNFFLKCTERMCGRVQLEVMKSTIETLERFKLNSSNLSDRNFETLANMTSNGIVPRCGFKGYKCLEGCVWGIKNGLDRKI